MIKGGNSKGVIEKLVSVGLSEEYSDREYDRRNFGSYYNLEKIRDGLWEVNNNGLFERIKRCGEKRGNFCGSCWCLRCRERIGKILEDRVVGYIDRLNLKNDDLRMVSGVIGLSDFSLREVNRNIKFDGLRWKRMKRRLDKLGKRGFVSVGYEFELVNGSFMFYGKGKIKLENEKENMFKRDQLLEILEDEKYRFDVDKRKLFLFNHFHGISNLDNDELKYVLGDEYFVSGKSLKGLNKCGWDVRRFFKDKELDVNVKKVSGYGFKNVYRFKYNFIGSDFKNGEYLSNGELGRLISLYDEVKGRGYRSLFRNIDNVD